MKKVLSVDDSKVVRTMVARHLKPFGVQVVEAENGQIGVETALAEKPDLILLDVTMPVMDGRQALEALRKDPATKPIPVIMLTAESGKELVVEIAKLGVSGYIVKPFNQETFEKAVSKILGAPGGTDAATAAPAPAAATPVDRRAVLVIDDSERVLEACKATLESAIKVLTAASGKDGVLQYGVAKPGIVVIDLSMPDMDGFQTLAKLKESAGADTRYIALSVRGDNEARDKARKAGFVAVLEKPLAPAELVEQVLALAELTPEESLKAIVAQEQGCPVFVLPDPKSKLFQKCMPLLQKKLKALVEEGQDRVVLDLTGVSDMTSSLTKLLVAMVTEAADLGLKTAICTTSEPIKKGLMEFAETKSSVYAASRGDAVQGLA